MFPITVETLRSNYQFHNTLKDLGDSLIPSKYQGLSDKPRAGSKREFCYHAVWTFRIAKIYVGYLCEQHNLYTKKYLFQEMNSPEINVSSVLKTYDAYVRKLLSGLQNTPLKAVKKERKAEHYDR